MKYTVLFLTIALVILFDTTNASAQKTKPAGTRATAANRTKNVVDFFLLLPNKYIGNLEMTRQAYLKKYATADTANGYLKIFAPDKTIYVATFKKDSGGYVITVATGTNEETKTPNYYFLEYDSKKWTDVSKQVLPADFSFSDYGDDYPCELPQYNRTINCRNREGKLTYLGWTGKDFVIE